ncbi:SDR family oxidoreductase [Mycobacterium spongiae]|uniref:SDR family oxidoreductase n=1 Tax=Mycobacterium spongiae TaxID=886343 RepID=UPI003CCEC0E3
MNESSLFQRLVAQCEGWLRTSTCARRVAADLPLGRVASPEEIAHCGLFLASEEASFVTGAVLVADGGGEIVNVGTLAFGGSR